MNRLSPPDAAQVRLYRLVALGIAYLVPFLHVLLIGFDLRALLGSLFFPTIRKAILLTGIGLQLYRLARPATATPRVYEYVETQGELGILGVVLFFDVGLTFANLGGGGLVTAYVFHAIDWFLVFALFGMRSRTVIDGNARTLTFGEVIPRKLGFDAIRGLGMVEVRLMRSGAHVGTTYHLAVFGREGAPKKIFAFHAPQDVQSQIAVLAADTGIPIARHG